MKQNTLLASQRTFESLAEHYQEQNLVFEISANEVFHLPDVAPKEKIAPLKFENDATLKRIIFYSNFAVHNNKTVSFDVINWVNSTSNSARYDTYEFTPRQERTLLKLTRFQESHPRNLALMQNAAILDYIDDVILVTEAEPVDEIGPRIIYVNQAFEKMSGYSLSEIFGKTPRIFQGEKTADTDRKKIREALKKWDPITIELVNYTKSKREFDVELIINPRKDEVGWYTHWVSVQRDVTIRKETQRHLEHHSKLALIGEIAAGVGHEINNPIAIIKGLLDMTLSSLKKQGVDDEKIIFNFERMNRASDRITNIAKGLRSFARFDSDESDYFCVYDMIMQNKGLIHRPK
jgi:PAS domain S-box-containing protein